MDIYSARDNRAVFTCPAGDTLSFDRVVPALKKIPVGAKYLEKDRTSVPVSVQENKRGEEQGRRVHG